jgi:hypothetical protein
MTNDARALLLSKLADPRERFIFQGGSDYALMLADLLSCRGYAKIMPPVPRPPLQIEERT